MVKNALEQHTRDHMWLMYLDAWVEKILQNIIYEDNEPAEFKNMYEYYLYEICSNLRDWIRFCMKDESNKNNELIIESAIASLVDCMKKVYDSNLREYTKSYWRSMFLDNYFDLYIYHNPRKTSKYMNKYKSEISRHIKSRPVNRGFADFLKYPMTHHQRDVWYNGAHYDEDVKREFVAFIDSLTTNTGGI
jgi:hypothetical protein